MCLFEFVCNIHKQVCNGEPTAGSDMKVKKMEDFMAWVNTRFHQKGLKREIDRVALAVVTQLGVVGFALQQL